MESIIQKYISEPMRESVIILIAKVFSLMFLFNTMFFAVEIFTLRLDLPSDYHNYVTLLLFFGHVIKSILEVYFVVKILLNWIGNACYFDISEKRLIKREGIFNFHEEIYDLKNIRSISLEQNIFGKLFHYGNIVITASASGGYNDKIYLNGISNPEKSEEFLKKCLTVVN